MTSRSVLSLGLSIAVTPTLEPEQHLGFEFRTCDLAFLLNPLPTLSAIQTLIELAEIPYLQLPEEMISDLTQYGDDDYDDDHDDDEAKENRNTSDVTPLGMHAHMSIRVENVQVLFLVDRKKVSRGIIEMDLSCIAIEFKSGELEGNLSLAMEPLVLRAGQIAQSQSSHTGHIDTILMPYQPIADFDGANVQVLIKEEPLITRGSQNQPIPDKMPTVRVNVKIGTESMFFNTSPSTIVALFGIVSSLDPFLDWIKGEHEAREEEQKRIKAQKELDSHRHVRLQREVLRRIFLEVDVDGSGGLSESELERVVLKLFDENNNSRGTASQEIKSFRPTKTELKRERDYLLSNIDRNRTNEITFQEMDE